MSLVSLVIILIVIGVLMWLVNTYIPIAPPFKQIINVVVIIGVVLWLLTVTGLLGNVGEVRVPRLR